MKKTLFILLGCLGLLSCSNSNSNFPTEDTAKKEVLEVVKMESKDKVEMTAFKKTNAVEEKMNAENFYTINFDGEVTYKQDGFSKVYENYDTKKGFLLVYDEKPYSYLDYYGRVKKGERKKVKGKIAFVKTEKDWEKIGVKIYINIE